MNAKYYLIPLAIAAVLGTASCVKLTEDPKGDLTAKSYFTSQNDLDASVSSIYQRLSVDGAWAFTNKSTSYFGADDLTTDPGLNKQDFREFDKLEGTAINGSIRAQWSGPWYAIYQANNVLANYERVPTIDDNAKLAVTRSVGQAYFLRGLSYFMLVRTFGNIPLVTKPLATDDRPVQVGPDKIYELIISDLKTAASMLPDKWDGKDIGRAGALASRALLANVYLTMAGWPLNQTSNFALAAAEADAVIKSKKYELVPEYADVFTTNFNSEAIFGIVFNVGGNAPNRSFGSTSVPLEESGADGSGGWDDFYPEVNFYLAAPQCKRTDATFYTTFKLKDDKGKFRQVPWSSAETRVQHPYYKKFRAGLAGDGVRETATEILTIQPSTNKTTDVIRYAETLLTYAEASAMATGNPSGDAYNAINLVRHRAGLPDLTPGLSAAAFRDSITFERKYEFAGEFGQRWFDIVRLQLLPKVISERSKDDKVEQNQLNEKYAGTPATRYYAPIPFNDLVQNPQWNQNPGY
ncbi:RagB/SusD family nutrient uptake outer membrane protein [Chitinophaga silvatica]|uniref:RagB/SusD family nutrient uptake outer membrane protein n=1 Tax=Chitinophaga silvatica TaxID=2282649 RepID=A0A3E1YHY7_9BACT|nr:RagB/SusD family nutrient uptake outer membrane protein [Chitinophaga silvatica]RFS26968.1 RagB/SusD family nutrient uptake outer membrane protein [Chitinophaga silvatica]